MKADREQGVLADTQFATRFQELERQARFPLTEKHTHLHGKTAEKWQVPR